MSKGDDMSADRMELLRAHLARMLAWKDAHAGFDRAVDEVPDGLQGVRPPGSPHSPWELLEHIRLAQCDILSFCRDAEYRELKWPDDYWPHSAVPPGAESWGESVAAMRRDRAALQALALDPAVDLLTPTPHGKADQTYLREILLVADHTSHHVGQLVLVRRLLGCWPTG